MNYSKQWITFTEQQNIKPIIQSLEEIVKWGKRLQPSLQTCQEARLNHLQQQIDAIKRVDIELLSQTLIFGLWTNL